MNILYTGTHARLGIVSIFQDEQGRYAIEADGNIPHVQGASIDAGLDLILSERIDQQARIVDLLAEREAMQKELAELRAEAAKPRMEWYPMPGVSQFEITEAMQKARDTEAARVPLMEGYYVRNDAEPIAWYPTYHQAFDYAKHNPAPNISVGGVKDLTDSSGVNLADLAPLRKAYYASQR